MNVKRTEPTNLNQDLDSVRLASRTESKYIFFETYKDYMTIYLLKFIIQKIYQSH